MNKVLISNKIEQLSTLGQAPLSDAIMFFKFIDFIKREPATFACIESYIDAFNTLTDNQKIIVKPSDLDQAVFNLFIIYLSISDLISRLELDRADDLIEEHLKFAADTPEVSTTFEQTENDEMRLCNHQNLMASQKILSSYLLDCLEGINISSSTITPIKKLDWSKIIFTSEAKSAKITTQDYDFVADYEELGFVDPASKSPSNAWSLLIEIAKNQGILSFENKTAEEKEELKRQKNEISDNLKKYFQAENDPIKFHKASDHYIMQIRLQ